MSVTATVLEAVYENGLLRPLTPLPLAEHEVIGVGISPRAGEVLTHPYVTQTPGVCGGRPVIRDTRIPVQAIIGYYKQGLNVEEILAGFARLTPAQVYDALSYYHDHQAEIEADIAASELPALLAKYHLQIDEDGVLRPLELPNHRPHQTALTCKIFQRLRVVPRPGPGHCPPSRTPAYLTPPANPHTVHTVDGTPILQYT